jgi:hypothetical protein
MPEKARHARKGAPAIAQGSCDVGMGRITAGKNHQRIFSSLCPFIDGSVS